MMAGLYLDTGVSYDFGHSACKNQVSAVGVCKYDANIIRNPLGHIELGWEEVIGRSAFTLYLRHESMITVNDKGMNSAGVSMRIYLVKK